MGIWGNRVFWEKWCEEEGERTCHFLEPGELCMTNLSSHKGYISYIGWNIQFALLEHFARRDIVLQDSSEDLSARIFRRAKVTVITLAETFNFPFQSTLRDAKIVVGKSSLCEFLAAKTHLPHLFTFPLHDESMSSSCKCILHDAILRRTSFFTYLFKDVFAWPFTEFDNLESIAQRDFSRLT